MSFITFSFSNYIAPNSNLKANSIFRRGLGQSSDIYYKKDIIYSQFDSEKNLESLLHAEEYKDNVMHNLTLVEYDDGQQNRLILAKEGEWEVKILSISKSVVEFKVIKQLRQKENKRELWLAFSPIKSNYQNFMIQKATELGVTKFLPVIFDRTIVRQINKERLTKIIIESTEQSNRMTLPTIEDILSPIEIEGHTPLK